MKKLAQKENRLKVRLSNEIEGSHENSSSFQDFAQ